jgi:hypothetical protein
MSEHEIHVRDLIQLIAVEGDAEKRKILAQQLERLLNVEEKPRRVRLYLAGVLGRKTLSEILPRPCHRSNHD